MKLRTQSGFTLVEGLVSIGLFVIIVGGIATTLYLGNRSWSTFNSSVRTQNNARNALDVLSRDLREGASISVTTSTGSLAMTFTDPDSNTVTYGWTEASGNISRQVSTATARNIATDFSALTITNSTDNVLINVTATHQENLGAQSSISLLRRIYKR